MSYRAVLVAALADTVAVGVFVAVGRASHAESEDVLGLLTTAAPFLLAAALARAVPLVRRVPAGLRAGAVVWPVTVVAGLAVRAAVTGRLPWVFALITAAVLGVLLLGWRALARPLVRGPASPGGTTRLAA